MHHKVHSAPAATQYAHIHHSADQPDVVHRRTVFVDGRTQPLKRAGGAVAMTVIIEFSLPADSFPFGRSTSGDPSVRVQLERLVPIGEDRIPFLWAT